MNEVSINKNPLDSRVILTQLFKTSPDKRKVFSVYCRDYYYFSLYQIQAFSQILTLLDAGDRASLSSAAEAISDEFGQGDGGKAHSSIFEKFSKALGYEFSLPMSEDSIGEGVKSYLNTMWEAFSPTSTVVKALASYLFLEESALDVYEPILRACEEMDFFTEDDLEYFALHSVLEVEHYKEVRSLIGKKIFSAKENKEFQQQYQLMKKNWEYFWDDMLDNTMAAVKLSA